MRCIGVLQRVRAVGSVGRMLAGSVLWVRLAAAGCIVVPVVLRLGVSGSATGGGTAVVGRGGRPRG